MAVTYLLLPYPGGLAFVTRVTERERERERERELYSIPYLPKKMGKRKVHICRTGNNFNR